VSKKTGGGKWELVFPYSSRFIFFKNPQKTFILCGFATG